MASFIYSVFTLTSYKLCIQTQVLKLDMPIIMSCNCWLVESIIPPLSNNQNWFSTESAHNRATCPMICILKVEVPIINHSKDSTPHLEKYKAVQFSPVYEDRNEEDCTFFSDFIPLNWNFCKFLKPKVGMNILAIFKDCHNCSFLLASTLKTKTCVRALIIPS